MTTIREINDNYLENQDAIIEFRNCLNRIADAAKDSKINETARLCNCFNELKSLLKFYNSNSFAMLMDTVRLGEKYIACCDAINDYKSSVLHNSGGSHTVDISIIERVTIADNDYKLYKIEFAEKYNIAAESILDLFNVCKESIIRSIAEAQRIELNLKSTAREIAKSEFNIQLNSSDMIEARQELPSSFLVARYPVGDVTEQILKDIGITHLYKGVKTDLRAEGNVLLTTGYENKDDRRIDDFITAYIIRYIEAFPLGKVNVHIFAKNVNKIYKKLRNTLLNNSSSETVRDIIQIHSSLSDLEEFNDKTCDDIYKKITTKVPDLFAVYDEDRTDPFNLIVLRDGFSSEEYNSLDELETINNLVKVNEIGHVTGLRFLIVNCNSDDETNSRKSLILNSIQRNCEMHLNFDSDVFKYENNSVEVLSIITNIEAFVEEWSCQFVQVLKEQEKETVSIETIAYQGSSPETMGDIMYIPVGISGTNTVELPLSCRDEFGTTAGQCIGFMCIGQSGSGKSSLFHSAVLNACLKYSPKDLQFWLLDFKNGGASSKYRNSGLPHINIIAENNKIDDALCLFQMILDEMEKRSKVFNHYSVDDINAYNRIAVREGLKYYPRIIIAIDEIQEIFRDENSSELQRLLSSISTRMRSFGMHFIMFAQNLSEGRSNLLKDSFLPSASGRICFRIAPNAIRDSGFGDDFVSRRDEINALKTGEAYISYGKDTIQKAKVAFVSSEEMNEKWFKTIHKKYPEFANMKPLVIGSKERLTILSRIQRENCTYLEKIQTLDNVKYQAILGEDAYRMNSLTVSFENDTRVIELCKKQESLIEQCNKNQWPLPELKYGVPRC